MGGPPPRDKHSRRRGDGRIGHAKQGCITDAALTVWMRGLQRTLAKRVPNAETPAHPCKHKPPARGLLQAGGLFQPKADRLA
jgi:hypothetical protein